MAPSDSAASISVMTVDDHPLLRAGIAAVIESQPDMRLVAEAASGLEALELHRLHRPDVTLMDIRMPKLDGLRATRLLAGPGVEDPLRVLVVTTYDVDENVYAALLAGACGFLLKDARPRLLVEAVHAAVRGEALVSPAVTVRLLAHFTGGAGPERPGDPLTGRELDVVLAVARGWTNSEIADRLHVSLSTVKSHLTNVQGKIGARNRTEIAIWAWRSGLLR